jgi:hypothetical protein
VTRRARRREVGRSLAVAAAVAVVVVAVPVAVLVTGPGDDEALVVPAPAGPEPTLTPSVADDPTPSTTASSTSDRSTTSAAPEPTAAAPAPTAAGLPGVSVEGEAGAARPGEVAGVMGVRFDDVLYVRSLPGPGEPAIGELRPTDQVTLLGPSRNLEPGFWWQVRTPDGVEGWVAARYLAYPAGSTQDLTSVVVEGAGGIVPTADSMADLGRQVAELMAWDGGEDGSSEVVVADLQVGDAAPNAVVDVVGLGDDSVAGLRLHVVGEVGPDGVYSLGSVEGRPFCARAADASGQCV